MYDINAIYEAKNVKEAINLLVKNPQGKVIAGGSDVLIKIRDGKLADCTLISIHDLEELRNISVNEVGDIYIGALNNFTTITKNKELLKRIPILCQAVDLIGGPQIRNIGTIGGNICNGVTSADSATTLLAYDAILDIEGIDGRRSLDIKDFYLGAGKVALKQDEILRGIIIKKASYERYFGKYIKYSTRNAMDIATIGCSGNVKLSEDKKTIEDIRIAFGVMGPTPMRAFKAENFAKDKEVSEKLVEIVSKTVLDDLNARDSWRATKAFREHLAVNLAREIVAKGIEQGLQQEPNEQEIKLGGKSI